VGSGHRSSGKEIITPISHRRSNVDPWCGYFWFYKQAPFTSAETRTPAREFGNGKRASTAVNRCNGKRVDQGSIDIVRNTDGF